MVVVRRSGAVVLISVLTLLVSVGVSRADCANMVGQFDRAVAAKALDDAMNIEKYIHISDMCNAKDPEIKQRLLELQFDLAADPEAPKDVQDIAVVAVAKNMASIHEWTDALGLADRLFKQRRYADAQYFYDRAIALAEINPGIADKQKRELLVKADTTKILSSSDDQGVIRLKQWVQAADTKAKNWTRDALLDHITGQTQIQTRDEAIAMLGNPNYSSESYLPGQGIYDRFDIYRLSARDDISLRLDYEPSGRVRSAGRESRPCFCPRCREADNGAVTTLSPQTASNFLNTPVSVSSGQSMLSEAERAAGGPGLKKVDLGVMTGGRPWANYSVVWRIADVGHRFLMAFGHIPMREYSADKDLPIDSYDVVMVTAECLVP